MRLTRRTFTMGMAAALALPGRSRAQPAAAEELVRPDILRADFAELYARLARVHFNLFAHRSRAAHDRLHADLMMRLDRPMSRAQALLLFQRFVAFGRVAHARIDSAADAFRTYRSGGGGLFPLDLRIREGRAFVSANLSGDSSIGAGDELVAIDGMDGTGLIASLWQDESADTAYMFHSMIEWDLRRLLWQRLGPRSNFDLAVRRGPRIAQVRVPARPLVAIRAEAASRTDVLNPESLDRTHRLIDREIGYFRPGPFYAAETPDSMYDNRRFVALVDEAFDSFLSAGVGKLIIDVRDNPGGDNSFSDPMISWFADRPFRFASAFRIKVTEETIASNRARLAVPGNDPTGISAELDRLYRGAHEGDIVDFPIPEARPRSGRRFEGDVFLLINRHSYSNTVTVAALVQDFGFGSVIGEETSDLATTYGAMETFALSRTGIVVGYPKARIVRPNGSLAARGAVPDIAIDTPIVEGADDPVLGRAIEIARRGARRAGRGRV